MATLIEEYLEDVSSINEELVHVVCFTCYPLDTKPMITLCGRDATDDRMVWDCLPENECIVCTSLENAHIDGHLT